MLSLCGNTCICIEECRLDKKLVGTARERDDLINVLLMIGGIDNVSDLLSPPRTQHVLLEHAERHRQVMANDNFTLVRCTPPDGSLGFIEPRPHAKPQKPSPSLHTLTRNFSSNAKARQGVP